MGERQVVFEFGGFRVDPVRRMLYGVEGQPIHLKPKAFNTLLYLVNRPHELVEKNALFEAVWPNVIVDENGLSQVISQLRRVLGEHPGDHRYILTEPGRGYRFVAQVNRIPNEGVPFETTPPPGDEFHGPPEHAPTPDSRASSPIRAETWSLIRIRSWPLAAATVLVLLLLATFVFFARGERDLRSVAVLPFVDLSAESEKPAQIAALHDDILTQLAKIGELKVIAHASVMQYQGADRDLREIGEQLGTATALESTVQQTAGAIHLNVRLVDTRTAAFLWSGSYDLDPADLEAVFAVQEDIAKGVATALGVSISPIELERLERKPTQSVKAYDFFLSGRRYAKGSDLLRDLPAAVRQFERAIEEDPDFALALANLAIENIHMYWTMDRTEARRAMAESAVQRALELQPDLPEAHLAMAWFLYQGHRDYEAALRELAIAEDGMPGDADVVFARSVIYTRMGKLDQALPSWERAVELDPRNPNLLRQYAGLLSRLRNYATAELYLDRVIEIAPDAVEAKIQKAEIPWLRDGDGVPYLQAIRGNPLLRPGEELLGEWHVAILARDYEVALAALDESQEEVVMQTRNLYKPLASLYGITYDLAGQHELAIQQFEMARRHLEDVIVQRPEGPVMLSLAEALAGLGQSEAATRLALQAIEATQAVGGESDAAECRKDAVIRVLVRAGAFDTAVTQLDKYLAEPGAWSIEGLLTDPRLDPLREDSRFIALVDKYRR